MMMHRFEFNHFCENTYLLWDEQTLDAAVLDAGMRTAGEEAEFAGFVKEHHLRLVMALQTHCHFDHIYGLPFLHEKYDLQPRFAKREERLYGLMPAAASSFGAPIHGSLPQGGDCLTEGEVLRVGDIEIQVIFTPGHTPGGVSFYLPRQRAVFTGDTLFRGSMGRTDLGGDEYEERRSILDRLLTLPSDTVVYPGHGPLTTVDDERINWGV